MLTAIVAIAVLNRSISFESAQSSTRHRLIALGVADVAEGAAEEAFPPTLEPAESQRLKAALAESRALFVQPA